MITQLAQIGTRLEHTAEFRRVQSHRDGRRTAGRAEVFAGEAGGHESQRRAVGSRGERYSAGSNESSALRGPETTSAARLLASMIQQMGGGERSYVKGSFVDLIV